LSSAALGVLWFEPTRHGIRRIIPLSIVSILDTLSLFIFLYCRTTIRLLRPSVTDEEHEIDKPKSKAFGGHDGEALAGEEITADQDSQNVQHRMMHGALGGQGVENNTQLYLRESDAGRSIIGNYTRETEGSEAGRLGEQRQHHQHQKQQHQQQEQQYQPHQEQQHQQAYQQQEQEQQHRQHRQHREQQHQEYPQQEQQYRQHQGQNYEEGNLYAVGVENQTRGQSSLVHDKEVAALENIQEDQQREEDEDLYGILEPREMAERSGNRNTATRRTFRRLQVPYPIITTIPPVEAHPALRSKIPTEPGTPESFETPRQGVSPQQEEHLEEGRI
jgi:hypothetical protein